MDAVRAVTLQQDGRFVQAELFPDLSVGDAPDALPLPAPAGAAPAARATAPAARAAAGDVS
jgi:hypothetical protein